MIGRGVQEGASAGESFKGIAKEWFERNRSTWAESHASVVWRRLERDVFPVLGQTPIGDVNAPLVLSVLRRVEERGTVETAHRIKTAVGQVMRYAVATGRAERDPTGDLKGALPKTTKKHLAAPTTTESVGAILRACEEYKGTPTVAAALALAPLVFVRPGELRQARWKDVDLANARWCFIASKTGTDHIVPLSQQAVAILAEQQQRTGNGASPFVFPSDRSKQRPMSDNALTAAYARMGLSGELTAHGWRATARTLLAEVLEYPAEVIEIQLAHAVHDPLGRAYNRTQWLSERTKMMQDWANALDCWKAPKPSESVA